MKDTIKFYFWLIVLIVGLISLFYFDFIAYKYRFPNAPIWTYFFQRR